LGSPPFGIVRGHGLQPEGVDEGLLLLVEVPVKLRVDMHFQIIISKL
jgi:hypothetical protein